MRIVRGKLKSRRFSVPKNFPSRPTTDFAKEGLFNVIENRFSLIDFCILDLCAGTGNITFEFLSREAGKVTAVDKDFFCCKFIRSNAKTFEVEEDLEVLKMDIIQYLLKTDKKFDLIFSDPPYHLTFHDEIVKLVFERNLLKPNGLLIIEHGKQTDISQFDTYEKTRNFGNVYFSFFSKQTELENE